MNRLPTDPDALHPLAAPGPAGRLAVLRVLSVGLAAGLVVVTASIVMVVQFALDGQPLAGNAVRFAGVSALTWTALAAALAAPVVGLFVAAAVTRAGVDKLAAGLPTPGGPDADRDRLLDVFAAGTFAEFAVAEGAGVLCALCYHLTADAVLLAAVAALAAVMVLRLPTAARAGRWYDEASARLADGRETADR